MFLGGEEREAVTWPERVLRVAFLFFVLLNTSTYTANLAAFFTSSGVTLHGPKDMQELSRARACGVWDEDTKYFGPYVGETVNSGVSYLGANVNFEELTKEGFGVCLDKLKEKAEGRGPGADIIVVEYAMAQAYLLETPGACSNLSLAGDIRFGSGWTFVFPLRAGDTRLQNRLNEALYHIHNFPQLGQTVLNDEFKMGQSCSDREIEDSGTAPVGLKSQSGIFIIVGALSGLAVLLEVLAGLRHRLSERSRQAKATTGAYEHDAERERTDHEMLVHLLSQVDQLVQAQGSTPQQLAAPMQTTQSSTAEAAIPAIEVRRACV